MLIANVIMKIQIIVEIFEKKFDFFTFHMHLTPMWRGFNGLFHLKFVHPLWKIWKSVPQGESEFSNAPCLRVSDLSQRELIFYLGLANGLVYLEFTLPMY